MELTKQVVSLELAQKLKELGVKQESYFYWEDEEHIAHYVTDQFDYERMVKKHPKLVSAFTVAELGEMLPEHTLSYKDDFGGWNCYNSSNTLKIKETFEADTEADARAKMLIYLCISFWHDNEDVRDIDLIK